MSGIANKKLKKCMFAIMPSKFKLKKKKRKIM